MKSKPLRIAIVGCGNIAGAYAKTLKPHSHIQLLGATDIDLQRKQSSAPRLHLTFAL